MMYNICLPDRITLRQYKADQAKIEKDGSLVLYVWDKVGPYKCPLRTQEVVRYAPGTFAWFERGDNNKDSE